jgi:hypothetical protein
MGIFDSYRQRRRSLTGPESVATLSYMEEFFQNGANWTQGVYHRTDGTKCLVGATDHVRVSSIDDAKFWVRQAIAERDPSIGSIEQFNDTRGSYTEVAEVIARAKQLAASAPRSTALTTPTRLLTGEILPPPSSDNRAPAVLNLRSARRMPQRVPERRPSLFDWKD